MKKHRWVKTQERIRGLPFDSWQYTYLWKCRRCGSCSSFRRKKPKVDERDATDCDEVVVRQVLEG